MTDDAKRLPGDSRSSKANLNAVLALLAGTIFGFGIGRASTGWFGENVEPDPTVLEQATPAVIEIDTSGRPARGPADAPVTLVEFTDYQCPFCTDHFRQNYPHLLSEYGDRLRYVVRNFPITEIHSDAQKAAEAAECAAVQGRFWEYHDLLFERQEAGLDVPNLKRYAEEAGLDPPVFDRCLDSGEMADVVATDVIDGVRYGITGTPAFFLNGRKFEGAVPLTAFVSLIDEALGR